MVWGRWGWGEWTDWRVPEEVGFPGWIGLDVGGEGKGGSR